MKTKIMTTILAGAFMVATALPMTALAGQHGRMKGQTLRAQTQTKNCTGNRDRLRLRDGSCKNSDNARSGAMEKKGNGYGPGDGTGYGGDGPKDGTGYGAPSQR
jgi:hypothetical protein